MPVSSNAQPYVSKLTNATCREISIRWENENVIYHTAQMECGDEIRTTFYNLTDIPFGNDHRFTIPDDGNSYWLIPFDGSGPYLTERKKAYCVNCFCYDGGTGYCSFYFGGGYCCYGSCACSLVIYECEGGVTFRSGAILVKAKTVFEE